MAKATDGGVRIDATELLQNFRSARHKREQIQIEADLHCCAPRVIAELLHELGALKGTGIAPGEYSDVYVPIPPAKPSAKRGRPRKGGPELSFDAEEARRLFAQGLTYGQMAQKLHCSRSAINHWAVYNGLRRRKAKEGDDVKKERPVEEALLDKETEAERHARILESVDAGKRPSQSTRGADSSPKGRAKAQGNQTLASPAGRGGQSEAMDGEGFPDAESRAEEPRTLTVGDFFDAVRAYLTEATTNAPLRINGEPARGFGVEISVRNNEVYVDLRTREASA